jgi:hypothetical protein
MLPPRAAPCLAYLISAKNISYIGVAAIVLISLSLWYPESQSGDIGVCSPVPRAVHYWSKFLWDAKKNAQEAAGLNMIQMMHVGGERVTSNFLDIHAGLLVKQAAQLTEEGIHKFEESLEQQIGREFKRWENEYDTHLSVDYHPCETIMLALRSGGMMERSFGFYFPFKTGMRIHPNTWEFDIIQM